MDELAIAGSDDGRELRQLLSQYDAPAYVRRARAVEGAYEALLARCRRERAEMAAMVRVRLGQLFALAGSWTALRPLLEDDGQLSLLRQLYDDLQPNLRGAPAPTASTRALRRALFALCESMHRFNERWTGFLSTLDLNAVNAARDGYNRHYVLEKECALRSPRLARIGFWPLPALTPDDMAASFPNLSVPRPAR
jgi:hypothetical protein